MSTIDEIISADFIMEHTDDQIKAALSAMVAEIIGENAKQVGSIPVSSAQARINRYKDEQRQRAIAKGFTL